MRAWTKVSLIGVLVVAMGGLYVVTERGLPAGLPGASKQAQAAQTKGQAAVPVQSAIAETQDVPIILRGLGTVTAFNTVAVKSRVQGNITRINFKEGQEVHAGDVLAEIDPRPYQAALDQATANLAKDQANLGNARKDLERYGQLLKSNFAPEQQFATQQATVAQNEATTKADQAQIDAAKLNVDYATIRSPIDGITGIRQVDVGNLVEANNGQTLVVVTQIKPIYVVFTVPEADIARVRDAMAKDPLKVMAYDAADEHQVSVGQLRLVDNQVDQTTGTVKLKAEFANTDERLWPGQFVNAHLVTEVVKNGVTVPAAAIQTGPKGSYAYVVKPDGTVEHRDLVVEQTERDRALVASGLKARERVVTGGQARLRNGSKVTLPDAGGKSATSAPQAVSTPMAGPRSERQSSGVGPGPSAKSEPASASKSDTDSRTTAQGSTQAPSVGATQAGSRGAPDRSASGPETTSSTDRPTSQVNR